MGYLMILNLVIPLAVSGKAEHNHPTKRVSGVFILVRHYREVCEKTTVTV